MYTSPFLLLPLLSSVLADGCDRAISPSARLKSDLLCVYDTSLPPVNDHRKAVPIVIRMLVKYIHFDIVDNKFTADTWISMAWMDDFLHWSPSEYDSITKIHLKHSEIWMPDISVYNRREQGGTPDALDSAHCSINHDGRVACVPSCRLTSLCIPDLTRYPYDAHNCTIRIGSWVHSGEAMNITLADPPVTLDDLEANGEWNLVSVHVYKHPGIFQCCPNNTYPSIYYSFAISRLHAAHAASILLPALALIVITLTSLWIAPDSPQRLALCYVNVICQFLYAQYVSYLLPLNGDNVPLIILFARDSLFLCTFTVVFSVALKNMIENKNPVPAWMSQVAWLTIGRKQLFFVHKTTFKGLEQQQDDDGAALTNTSDNTAQNKDRLLLAKNLDMLLFVIYVIVYICMFAAFAP